MTALFPEVRCQSLPTLYKCAPATGIVKPGQLSLYIGTGILAGMKDMLTRKTSGRSGSGGGSSRGHHHSFGQDADDLGVVKRVGSAPNIFGGIRGGGSSGGRHGPSPAASLRGGNRSAGSSRRTSLDAEPHPLARPGSGGGGQLGPSAKDGADLPWGDASPLRLMTSLQRNFSSDCIMSGAPSGIPGEARD